MVLVRIALLFGLLTAGACGEANAAPVFDDPGYSACTAKAAGQSADDAVTSCCPTHGGVPFATNFGLGCVAQVDNPAPDYRPTIYMPTRPAPEGEDDGRLDELEKLPPLPSLPEP